MSPLLSSSSSSSATRDGTFRRSANTTESPVSLPGANLRSVCLSSCFVGRVSRFSCSSLVPSQIGRCSTSSRTVGSKPKSKLSTFSICVASPRLFSLSMLHLPDPSAFFNILGAGFQSLWIPPLITISPGQTLLLPFSFTYCAIFQKTDSFTLTVRFTTCRALFKLPLAFQKSLFNLLTWWCSAALFSIAVLLCSTSCCLHSRQPQCIVSQLNSFHDFLFVVIKPSRVLSAVSRECSSRTLDQSFAKLLACSFFSIVGCSQQLSCCVDEIKCCIWVIQRTSLQFSFAWWFRSS